MSDVSAAVRSMVASGMGPGEIMDLVVREVLRQSACSHPGCRAASTGFFEGRHQFNDSEIPEDFYAKPRALCEPHGERSKASGDNSEYSNWCPICGCFQPIN